MHPTDSPNLPRARLLALLANILRRNVLHTTAQRDGRTRGTVRSPNVGEGVLALELRGSGMQAQVPSATSQVAKHLDAIVLARRPRFRYVSWPRSLPRAQIFRRSTATPSSHPTSSSETTARAPYPSRRNRLRHPDHVFPLRPRHRLGAEALRSQ